MTTKAPRRKANRVNADALAVLIEITGIPRTKGHYRLLRFFAAQTADALVRIGLAECSGPADKDGSRAFRATDKGRQVAAAMFAAAHREIYGEESEYRA